MHRRGFCANLPQATQNRRNTKPEVSIFLLRLAPFEKSTFEFYFKLAGQRDTGDIVLKDIAQAQVVVVNGDNFADVQFVTKSVKSPQNKLFIGAPDPSGKRPVVAKPTRLSTILGLGNSLAVNYSKVNLDFVLIVDGDDISLKFMRKHVVRNGFQAELAKTFQEALVRVSMGKFKFVCLEVVLPGMDGYQVCRDIKHDSYASGKPPVVVMFSSRGANTDKIRGCLAGFDA